MSESPQPLLSVIIPAYNTGRYIGQCLESVCGQTYRNLEIICVNDGSTDDTLTVMQGYAARDQRIRVIDRENGGLSVARNDALDIATGEWIIGLDSDDWLPPHAYEHAMALTAGGIDAVIFSSQAVLDDGTETVTNPYYSLPERHGVECTNAFILEAPAMFCSKLHRRAIIEKYRLRFPVGAVHEDEFFHLLYLAHASRASLTSERLYYYRSRPGAITHKPNVVRTARMMSRLAETAYTHFKETGILAEHYPSIRNILVYKGYTQLTRKKNEVPAMEIEAWRADFSAMAERCGMAADPLLGKLVTSIRNSPAPWYHKLFGWDNDPARPSFRVLGLPVWEHRSRQGRLRKRFLGITIGTVKEPA